MARLLRRSVVLLACASALAACGGTDSGSTTTVATATTAPPTTTTTAPDVTTTTAAATTTTSPPSTQDVLDAAIASVILPDGVGSAIVAVVDADGSVTSAVRGEAPDGTVLAPDSVVRVGSVTKTLTATTVMALVDAGLVDLDAPANEYVTRVPLASEITVRDLLQQTSGIPDYTQSDEFFIQLFSEPERVWTPEEGFAFVEGDSDFAPGSDWDYSNTNYTVLGILVEEVTGQPFHEVLRSSVLDPGGSPSSYLAHFETGSEPAAAYTSRGPAVVAVDFDYTSVATAAWASGSVVSDVVGLSSLLRAVFAAEVVSPESVGLMTTPVEWETTFYGIPAAYGFGTFRLGDTQFAHDGRIPGFITVYAHDTSTGSTAIWVVANDAATIPRPSFAAVLDLLAPG